VKARDRRWASAGRCPARSHGFRAWIVTGPLGHLWSALADMTLIWARYLAHRARGGGR
jgi:hypothetical protein